MNYPVWELTHLGGGSFIALISVPHVYIAHLAVGAGFFLWYMDRLGFRTGLTGIHDYVRKHTFFFLLLSMVFGGVTGVGIWFIIALVHPSATSILIHEFVFLWAIEWVFFVCEIVSLLLYHYRFDALGSRRTVLALLYGVFAWFSLFIIGGIISFMLTPGKWTATGNLFHAFFNPTFLPSLAFRTAMSLAIAALFGHMTAVLMSPGPAKDIILRELRRWLLVPLGLVIPLGLWYYFSIPYPVRQIMTGLNPQTMPFLKLFLAGTVIIFAIGLVLLRRKDPLVQKSLAVLLLVIGLLWIGGFEYMREIARKPYVIQGYMYSTSVPAGNIEELYGNGFLARARWTSTGGVDDQNQLQAGRELFRLQCLSCHTIHGIRNDIIPRTRYLTEQGVLAQLNGQGRVLAYMPPFMGNEAEKRALARYISRELNHQPLDNESVQAKPQPQVIPPASGNTYRLFAWSTTGMNERINGGRWFTIGRAGARVEAILLAVGETPVRVNDGIVMRYSGPGVSGTMSWDEGRRLFYAADIRILPGSGDGFNPYPVIGIEAVDPSGNVVASTSTVVPVTDESGCVSCHAEPGKGGIFSDEAAMSILRIHDRIHGTSLRSSGKATAVKCDGCHGVKGKAGSLSSSIHGWHSLYIPDEDASACTRCHPADGTSRTSYYRGIHKTAGMTCVECHGTLRAHALSLLAGEKTPASKAREGSLMRQGDGQFPPRRAGKSSPDCLACHDNYGIPGSADSFGHWTAEDDTWKVREDGTGLPCMMCHGSAHALYPCGGPDAAAFNLQPLQHTGKPYPIGADGNCRVCHGRNRGEAPHHPGMNRTFRNR